MLDNQYFISEAERRFGSRHPHVCLTNAAVQAFLPPIEQPDGFHGGPVLTNESHRIFRHHRNRGPRDHFDDDQAFDHFLPGEYTYAGPLYDHFGHFMSEVIHRIVPAQMIGLPRPYLFVTEQGGQTYRTFDQLPAFMQDVLSFLDISSSDVFILNQNSIVERLHIAEQGASIANYPKPGYCEALYHYSTRRLDRLYGSTSRPTRLYVSRSSFSKIGGFLGESFVEREFEKVGFEVYRPEKFSVSEQLDYYRKAKTLLFSGGSACHGAELLGKQSMGDVFYIPRLPFQNRIFERLFKQRARSSASLDLSTHAGTLITNRDDCKPAVIRGVSIFDLNRVDRWLTKMGLPLPKRLSTVGYLRSALRDLSAYDRETKQLTERNATSAMVIRADILKTTILDSFRTKASHDTSGRKPKYRILTDAELLAIVLAISDLQSFFKDYFLFNLLLLQSHDSILELQWSHLSSDFSRWYFAGDRFSGSAARSIVLPEAARSMLRNFASKTGSNFVFHRKGKPLRGLRKEKDLLDFRIAAMRGSGDSFPPWTFTDLRRSAGQFLEEEGFDRMAVRALIGFSSSSTAWFTDNTLGPAHNTTEMLESWADKISTYRSQSQIEKQ